LNVKQWFFLSAVQVYYATGIDKEHPLLTVSVSFHDYYIA